MILNSKHVQTTINRLVKVKTISKIGLTHEEITDYFTTINKINALEYGETLVDGSCVTEKYTIPDELKDLILPAQLQIEVGNDSFNFKANDYTGNQPNIIHTYSKWVDGKEVEHTYTGKVLNAEDFNDISLGIQGVRKAQNNDKLVSVSTLLVRATISDKLSRLTNRDGALCHDSATAFVPIYCLTEFKKKSWYNEEVDNMFNEWFKQQMLKM